jgi:subtilisin family serine protease
MKTKLKILLFIFLSVTTLQATDKYIIFLQDKSQSNKTITQIAKKLLNIPSNKKNKIIKVYKVLNGFSAKLDSQTATELKYAPEVKLIERDKIITVAFSLGDVGSWFEEKITNPIGNWIKEIFTTPTVAVASDITNKVKAEFEHNAKQAEAKHLAKNKSIYITHYTSSWGLDRIDQKGGSLDAQYKYNYTGKGVHAYIIDSGINHKHNEFKSRIGNGIDLVDNDDIANDCHGHGTHVAGTLAGTKYGVAKDVIIHPVRISDCSGESTSERFLSAINWVLKNHIKPAVVNISLVGDNSKIYNIAIDKLTKEGITTVIAAGNDNDDACSYSPASAPSIITVGATTKEDEKSGFSNTGKCVDIFAPGSDILSASIYSNDGKVTHSGTSMAVPFVAGVVAKYLEKYPNSTPSDISTFLVDSSIKNKIINLEDDTPNRLLYGLINKPSTKSTTSKTTNNDTKSLVPTRVQLY